MPEYTIATFRFFLPFSRSVATRAQLSCTYGVCLSVCLTQQFFLRLFVVCSILATGFVCQLTIQRYSCVDDWFWGIYTYNSICSEVTFLFPEEVKLFHKKTRLHAYATCRNIQLQLLVSSCPFLALLPLVPSCLVRTVDVCLSVCLTQQFILRLFLIFVKKTSSSFSIF